ncbi:MAG: PKD domain-containing protein, partial [Alphaproteobacteria bacterium]|nr:PKD domain-containing protein [Alphaproteobacteria bacterium]
MILFTASVLLLIGCKKVTVDFTYSPAEPKAGETVSFTNLSSAGETWAWSFGDHSTSLSKIPSKIYKKAGTYT